MAIVEDILQPAVNHGLERVILDTKFLQEVYGVDSNTISYAKKMLIQRKILSVAVKSRAGRTTVFRINDEYKLENTQKLLYALIEKHGPVKIDNRTGNVVDSNGEILTTLMNYKDSSYVDLLPESLPSNGFDWADRYLKEKSSKQERED